MESWFTFQCCCCFSGNVLYLHQFSSKAVILFHRFIFLSSSPSVCSWFMKNIRQHTISRTTISAALLVCFGSLSLAANVCTLCRECSQCQFTTQILWQGLFLLPLDSCESTSLQGFRFIPFHFNRKTQGSVISFPLVNYFITNRANCFLQRCIVHDISVFFLAVKTLQLSSLKFIKWESFLICIIPPFCVVTNQKQFLNILMLLLVDVW